jgi:hypothetical protein
MTDSAHFRNLARQARRRAARETSLEMGAEERRFATYFDQLADAQEWLDDRRRTPVDVLPCRDIDNM